jgi:hypothetical protein
MKWAYNGFVEGQKAVFSEAHGKSKATLYSGLHLAYHSSMPQARIPHQILKGSAQLFAVAVSSQEAVWFDLILARLGLRRFRRLSLDIEPR